MSREYQPVDADIMANLVICPGCYGLVPDTKTIMHELICKGSEVMARYGLDDNGEHIPNFDEAFPDNGPAPTDHFAEAERILKQSFDWSNTDVGQLAQLLRAQVHATLATVYDQ